MTVNEIMLVRIRLTEADLLMGQMLVEQGNAAAHGKLHSYPAITVHLILSSKRTRKPSD